MKKQTNAWKGIPFRKRIGVCLVLLVLAAGLAACKAGGREQSAPETPSMQEEESSRGLDQKESQGQSGSPEQGGGTGQTAATEEAERAPVWKNPEGTTLEARVLTPEGYERVEASEDSLLFFMRKMQLKEDGSPILLYNGQERGNQQAAFAVFAMDVGSRDLQQCADSVMRIYGEYDWQRGAYEEIVFPFGNGFSFDYMTWRKGGRISVNGNQVTWQQTAAYDDSYGCFRKYLTMAFAYAGTASLSKVCQRIPLEKLQAGDMLLKGGSPGHCVLAVDEAVDANGKRCYLFAQGFMPAQDFHVLVNPLHPEDPWYYEEELAYPVRTPQYVFEEGTAARFREFPR